MMSVGNVVISNDESDVHTAQCLIGEIAKNEQLLAGLRTEARNPQEKLTLQARRDALEGAIAKQKESLANIEHRRDIAQEPSIVEANKDVATRKGLTEAETKPVVEHVTSTAGEKTQNKKEDRATERR